MEKITHTRDFVKDKYVYRYHDGDIFLGIEFDVPYKNMVWTRKRGLIPLHEAVMIFKQYYIDEFVTQVEDKEETEKLHRKAKQLLEETALSEA